MIRTFLCLSLVAFFSCTQERKPDQPHAKPDFIKAGGVIKNAPDFSGENYDGRTIGLKDLGGRVWVASFMFTRCEGPCPVINRNLSRIQKKFAGKDISFVTFTVDPEYDTKEVLGEAARKYEADNSWYFLNMPLDTLRNVAVKGFLVGDFDSPTVHTTRYILVDRKQQIRAYYDGTDSGDVEALIHDLTEFSDKSH